MDAKTLADLGGEVREISVIHSRKVSTGHSSKVSDGNFGNTGDMDADSVGETFGVTITIDPATSPEDIDAVARAAQLYCKVAVDAAIGPMKPVLTGPLTPLTPQEMFGEAKRAAIIVDALGREAPAPATPSAPPPEAERIPDGDGTADIRKLPGPLTIAHVVSEKGTHYCKVYGGVFTKFGITAWPEVMEIDGIRGWQTWEIGQKRPAPYSGARVQFDGKKPIKITGWLLR